MAEQKAKSKSPRVLLWDLETSLEAVTVFSLQNQDWINPDSIIRERSIICASWKWLGEKQVYSTSVLDDPKRFAKDPSDDRFVVETLHKVLSEADCLIGHNQDSFDRRYLNTRILYHGLSPLPPITSVDTLKLAKGFYFNSNRLDYLGKYLKVGQKMETSPGLWMRVFNGEKKAIKEMEIYNRADVELLERVFMKLRPYASNAINRELFGGTGCPKCGSTRIQSRGFHRAISRVYQRYQCQSCASWFRLATNEKDIKPKFRVL